ncbi:hypothetical protein NQ315_009108 [Exocentrus adspersus]|uniref:DUF4781 domain-containing protein n=1 Tax=Exocentrus adspersus TaxID=1586481 RepID=A0AAV8WGS9_9CUCU|nr:hypothetical protein NQ315_009108 [Exocentrus adspersus]
MEQENKLCFFITLEGGRTGDLYESLIELYEYDTVELLKLQIHNKFNIPPHKQVISGWKCSPECDNTILKICAESDNVNYLKIREQCNGRNGKAINSGIDDSHPQDAVLEVEATVSFIKKVCSRFNIDGSIAFNSCAFADAISEACLVPLEKRKILLLYLYKGNDKFSTTFMENLRKPEVIKILRQSFFILGWDMEEVKYQDAFKKALQRCSDLSNIAEVVNYNVSKALCIVPIRESITIYSCLTGSVSYKDFLSSLSNAQNFLNTENQQEKDLEELEKQVGNENDMDSGKYQQLMVDMLGDRDYDGFDHDQHKLLKEKIAFALMGPPKAEEGYDAKDMKQVEPLFKAIMDNSKLIMQYKDRVEVSFIFNCTEPLPSEKIKRAKKFPDYNPNTDLMPVPIFVLRKCHESENPCRVFIDHTGRTYSTWDEYMNRNKLHQCVMVLPLNGRYEVDHEGNVLLEKHLSPACGIDTKILQGADYVSVAGGLISGGIFVAAALPAIAVAPAALVVGGITGVAVGVYSIARSSYTLYDRKRHKETLSFKDSEVRGAYINILAGALGFVGAGANVAVTQLAARGVNIGKGASAVVDAFAFVNLGVSGASVLNSGYDIFDKWYNENQAPSLLSIVQLSSSILFFGNALYNFKSCSTIIEETQMKTLKNYQESLRSNRHRKTFSKLLKETIRQNEFNEVQGRAEVISAIRNVQNKDEVFAALTRSNKDMNKKGHQSSFDVDVLTNVATRLLSFCNEDIKTKVIGALATLLASLVDDLKKYLDELFPYHSKFSFLINVVIGFFSKVVEKLEEQYNKWKETGDESYYNPIFDYVDVEKAKRIVIFFEKAVNMYYIGTEFTEFALKELLTYFHSLLAEQIVNYNEDKVRQSNRQIHSASSPTTKTSCKECGGYYYRPSSS